MRRLLAVLLIVLTGCQYDPFTAIYTRKQPKIEDLLGVYVPDEDTKREIIKGGHYPTDDASIILGPNGVIAIKNIPDWWQNPSGKLQGGLDSGSGTWEVEKHQEWWVIRVRFDSAVRSSSYQQQIGGFLTDVLLTGEKPPYTIHVIIGDPDEGIGMNFVRAANETQ